MSIVRRELLTHRSPFNDAPVYFMSVVSSTMDEAAALAEAGAPAGTVIMTDFQERGKGRRAAAGWMAAPGENLLFTVLLPRGAKPVALSRAPLAAGLAVAYGIESLYSLAPAVKWPNDVLLHGRKVCGILCSIYRSFILAGIGINCNQMEFPADLREHAISLAHELGKPVDRQELLFAVLRALTRTLDSDSLIAEVEARLAFRGERRRIVTEAESGTGRTIEGVVAGLGPSGEIILITEEHPEGERFFSGSLL